MHTYSHLFTAYVNVHLKTRDVMWKQPIMQQRGENISNNITSYYLKDSETPLAFLF
jgi:hypothetical protein